MNKFLTILFVVLLSCNTAKRTERQLKQAERIAEVVAANKVVIKKDTAIYMQGQTVVKRDTLQTFDSITNERYFYFTTNNFRTDTIRNIEYDLTREKLLENANIKLQAENEAANNTLQEVKQYFIYALIALLVVVVVFVILLFIFKK